MVIGQQESPEARKHLGFESYAHPLLTTTEPKSPKFEAEVSP